MEKRGKNCGRRTGISHREEAAGTYENPYARSHFSRTRAPSLTTNLRDSGRQMFSKPVDWSTSPKRGRSIRRHLAPTFRRRPSPQLHLRSPPHRGQLPKWPKTRCSPNSSGEDPQHPKWPRTRCRPDPQVVGARLARGPHGRPTKSDPRGNRLRTRLPGCEVATAWVLCQRGGNNEGASGSQGQIRIPSCSPP